MINIPTIITFYVSPVIFGIIAEVLMILGIAFLLRKKPDSKISILFEIVYTKMYAFYVDILGKESSKWVLMYIMTLFFVIFFSNFLSVLLGLIAPFFGIGPQGEFYLEHYINVPSSDINFNLSMAIMSMCVLIYIQIKAAGFGGFLYQFVPFRGKGFIPLPQKNLPFFLYYPSLFILKGFDILISIFLGLLDLTEYFARTISLSFRLFGNMVSGGILMGMVFIGLGASTTLVGEMIGKGFEGIFSFIGIPGVGHYITSLLAHNFPVIIPIFLYLEEFMVSFIQAMVFALLVSIFIKVALAEVENEQELTAEKEQEKARI